MGNGPDLAVTVERGTAHYFKRNGHPTTLASRGRQRCSERETEVAAEMAGGPGAGGGGGHGHGERYVRARRPALPWFRETAAE